MGAIDGQCLLIVALRLFKVPFVEKNVGDMADCVGQRQRVLLLSEEFGCKLVVHESRADILAVSIDLAKSDMCLRRMEFVVGGSAQAEGAAEAVAGVVGPLIAPRLVAARDPLSRGGRGHWASVACGRIEE